MSAESELNKEMIISMLSSSRAEVSQQKAINENLKSFYEEQLDMILNLTAARCNIDTLLQVVYKLKRIYGNLPLEDVENNLKDLKEGKLWSK